MNEVWGTPSIIPLSSGMGPLSDVQPIFLSSHPQNLAHRVFFSIFSLNVYIFELRL